MKRLVSNILSRTVQSYRLATMAFNVPMDSSRQTRIYGALLTIWVIPLSALLIKSIMLSEPEVSSVRALMIIASPFLGILITAIAYHIILTKSKYYESRYPDSGVVFTRLTQLGKTLAFPVKIIQVLINTIFFNEEENAKRVIGYNISLLDEKVAQCNESLLIFKQTLQRLVENEDEYYKASLPVVYEQQLSALNAAILYNETKLEQLNTMQSELQEKLNSWTTRAFFMNLVKETDDVIKSSIVNDDAVKTSMKTSISQAELNAGYKSYLKTVNDMASYTSDRIKIEQLHILNVEDVQTHGVIV